MADLQDLIRRLEAIDEELTDLALIRLRDGIDGDPTAAADEKRITKARRSVEKAAGLLGGGSTL